MLRSDKTSRARILLAAVLVLEAAIGSSSGFAQQGGATAPSANPNPAPLRACRVKEHAGGKTCTANVVEGVCAAIARGAGGTYTWTEEVCP